MTIAAANGRWLADILTTHEDAIVATWTETVARTMRGRLTATEL